MAFDERERIILYRDPTTDGLQLRLGRHRATWLFYWDDRRHRRRRITSKRLGFFPAMRTEEARDAARVERGRVAAGEVGPGKREAVKVETSLAEYVAHLERKAAAKHKPARWAYNVRHLVKSIIAPRWGQWSLADVAMHPGAVADWHRDVTEANGPVSANHCCRVLRAAYKRSAKRDVSLPQRDPCSAVEYNIETPAQKAMAFRDFPKWLKPWQAIEVGPKAPARKEYHLFCLLTGMRPGEAARMPSGELVVDGIYPGGRAGKAGLVFWITPANVGMISREPYLFKPDVSVGIRASLALAWHHHSNLPLMGVAVRLSQALSFKESDHLR